MKIVKIVEIVKRLKIVKIVKIVKMVWLVKFEISSYFGRLSVITSCQVVIKSFDSINGLRDIKSNCMPKFSLIGWVWNFALFWQLISCHKLSSCHKKVLSP